MPLLDYFTSYKRLDPRSIDNANKALVFLQREFRETSQGALDKFDEIWLNGQGANQPLSFINVARFFDPGLAHHDAAIKELDRNIIPSTMNMFDGIWHGRVNWVCPADTDPLTGIAVCCS